MKIDVHADELLFHMILTTRTVPCVSIQLTLSQHVSSCVHATGKKTPGGAGMIICVKQTHPSWTLPMCGVVCQRASDYMWWAGVGTASVVCDRREAVVVVHTLLPARLSERLSLGRHDRTRARWVRPMKYYTRYSLFVFSPPLTHTN
jgi:hypothetical protein